jgi:hypothetical protein
LGKNTPINKRGYFCRGRALRLSAKLRRFKWWSAPIIQCADEVVKEFFRFLRKNFLTKLGKKSLDKVPDFLYNIHIKIEKEKKTENKLNNAGRQNYDYKQRPKKLH